MNELLALVVSAGHLGRRLAAALAWLPPATARVGVGWLFVQTGWGKLNDLEQVAGFFAGLGLPAPGFHAGLVAGTELTCGALVLVGLATRLAAVPLAITMLVAIRTALWEQVDSLASLFGLTEMLYAVIFAWLATAGPGPVSLDRLIARLRGTSTDAARPVLVPGSAARA